MRISLLNTRFFMIGGDTRYTLNALQLLEDFGHDVTPFSSRYSESITTGFEEYWVDPPGGRDSGFYRAAESSLRHKLGLLVRSTWSPGVYQAFRRLLRDRQVELAYSVNICNFLGPSVIDAARAEGVPYVMRLSDYNLMCPSYHHVRDGASCEDCRSGLIHGIKNRCLQGSLSVSAARVLSMWAHRIIGSYGRVDRIVTPSRYLKTKLGEVGYDVDRIHHIPTFVDLELFAPGESYDGNDVVYCGRLAPEKGVEQLIRAGGLLDPSSRLKIVFLGRGEADYEASLRALARSCGASDRVEFAGFLKGDALRRQIQSALCVVHPSLWFENMPNSVTEAMAMARPVVGSRIGSIPEQVIDGETGLVVDPYDTAELAEALMELEGDRRLAERLGRAGRERAEIEYSPARHHERLMEVFELARSGRR